jgi:hypothetical protein
VDARARPLGSVVLEYVGVAMSSYYGGNREAMEGFGKACAQAIKDNETEEGFWRDIAAACEAAGIKGAPTSMHIVQATAYPEFLKKMARMEWRCPHAETFSIDPAHCGGFTLKCKSCGDLFTRKAKRE